MKLRAWTAALLVLPFVVVAVLSRSYVPAWGDAAARQLRLWTRGVFVHPSRRAPRGPFALPEGLTVPSSDAVVEPLDAGAARSAVVSADGGAVASAPPNALRIPEKLVRRAMEDAGRQIKGRTTLGPDGKRMGVRLTGVNGRVTGLHDGDVIVAVDGKASPDEDAAIDAALSVIARGSPTLHATLLREGQPFDVTLDLPGIPH